MYYICGFITLNATDFCNVWGGGGHLRCSAQGHQMGLIRACEVLIISKTIYGTQ